MNNKPDWAIEGPKLVEVVRKLAIKQHVRIIYGDDFVPSGASCELCGTEWEEGEDEHHETDCIIARTALSRIKGEEG